MFSTFQGLETAKRGLSAQQGALYTTGQNISNANTDGYSRQRVNLTTTTPFPTASMNRPQIPGQMGTGVMADSVQRIRDSFIDTQYRTQNNQVGYWSTKADAMSQMEDIMNEPTDSGLSATMGEFWQSLQDLQTNPEDNGARAVVLERGQSVADTFNYLSNSLSTVQTDLGNEIGVSIKDINSILNKISQVNAEIGQVEPHGYLPNDLYDERDRLVDQLSSYMDIKVEKVSSGGNSVAQAEGQYKITLQNPSGQSAVLVDGNTYHAVGIKNGVDTDRDGVADTPSSGQPVSAITVNGTDIPIASNGTASFSQGKLRGLIESYGYQDGSKTAGSYPDMLKKLDQLAYTFGTVFNAVHEKGYTLDGSQGQAFFNLNGLSSSNVDGAAAKLKMNSLEPGDVAASSVSGNAGDGKNVTNLANVQDMNVLDGSITLEGNLGTLDLSAMNLPFKTGSVSSNYQSMIGSMGVEAQQANRMETNSNALLDTVNANRQSVSSVSLDEEMVNMIKYQQAYNASARNITIVDEMLDKIINGLGTGGR